MSTNIAEHPVEFIAQFDFNSIPNMVIQFAKRCFVDGIATILAGATTFSVSERTHIVLMMYRSRYA